METKRKKMFFCTFVFFLSLLLSLTCVQMLHATIFISENWDSGTPTGCWPCETGNCNSSFHGWKQYMDYDFVFPNSGLTAPYHTAPYSYYIYKNPGNEAACVLGHSLDTNPNHIFVRFYIYFTGNGISDWVNSRPSNGLIHWMFTNTMLSNSGFQLSLVTNDYWGNCPVGDLCLLPWGNSGGHSGGAGGNWWDTEAQPTWNSTAWTDRAPIDFLQYKNKWTCMEFEMELSAGDVILTLYINGVQKAHAHGPGDSQGNFDMLYIHLYDNTQMNYKFEYYIDDIVVSDQYIGPLGGSNTTTTLPIDTTPPNPPTGLDIIESAYP